MNPQIIQMIAAEQIRDQHERAARTRTAREIRRSRAAARPARARRAGGKGPLALPRALARAKA